MARLTIWNRSNILEKWSGWERALRARERSLEGNSDMGHELSMALQLANERFEELLANETVANRLIHLTAGVSPGKFVAISSSEELLLGQGDTVEEAIEDARRCGEQEPVVFRVPDCAVAI
jgi:hypothetical protein